MAASPWRVVGVSLATALTVWVWALAGVLFTLRWNAIERPGPPLKEVFPYGELRIGVDASYPPFAVATADDLFGLDIDLGKALAENIGIPVRFVNMGFDGLYDSLRADQVDIVISALRVDPGRLGDVRYTTSYFNAGLVLVSSNPAIQTMEDLPGYALAYEFGSDADIQAKHWLRRVQPFATRPYETPAYALDAVRLGEADAALTDAVSALLYLRQYPEWNAHYTAVTDEWYAIASRIDKWTLWATVEGGLQTLIQDGTLEALIRRWL
ncbi:MAG: amino acid ABC transporter substrate-binding protein [Anaerolineaceae bacterium]|nr:amino acid ABC transporter substrate-binding protein [Anaerolineaceae bacterium]